MILYEWVYNRGELAEGVFCSEKCAENMYFDNPHTAYKGSPSPIDEQESQELAADEDVMEDLTKLIKFQFATQSTAGLTPSTLRRILLAMAEQIKASEKEIQTLKIKTNPTL